MGPNELTGLAKTPTLLVRFAVPSPAMLIEAAGTNSSEKPGSVRLGCVTFDVFPVAVKVIRELVNEVEPREPLAVTDSVNLIACALAKLAPMNRAKSATPTCLRVMVLG